MVNAWKVGKSWETPVPVTVVCLWVGIVPLFCKMGPVIPRLKPSRAALGKMRK